MRKLLLLLILGIILLYTPAAHAQQPGQGCVGVGTTTPYVGGGTLVCVQGSDGTLRWILGGGGGGSTPTPGSQTSFGATVSPLAYGAKWDAKFIYDVATTASSATVTAPESDANWTSADVGKIFFSFKGPQSVNQGASLFQTNVAQTTILSVQSTTSITLNSTAAATCTPATSDLFVCTAAWGTQDDATAMNNAMNAAWRSAATCQSVELPSGAAFFGANIFNSTIAQLSSACGGQTGSVSGGADTTQTGPTLFGNGWASTVLIPLPSLSETTATCTNGQSGKACNFATPALSMHDFGINGLANNGSGSQAVNLVELFGSSGGQGCTGSTGFNLAFANWLVSQTNTVGLDMGRFACASPTYFNIISEMFGATNCAFNTGATLISTAYALACFGASAQAFTVNVSTANNNGAPAILNTSQDFFGVNWGVAAAVIVTGGAGGIWNTSGDFFLTETGPGASAQDTFEFSCNGAAPGCVVNASGDVFELAQFTSASQVFLTLGNAAATFHLKNSNIAFAGANNRLWDHTAGTMAFFDDGGNTYQVGSTQSVFTGGAFSYISDGHGAKGIGTGVCTSSSTLGLRVSGTSLTGTGITTACTSTTLDAGFPVSGPRTAFGFTCSSSATTVSVACTVMKSHNGGAFASTGITCTMTAATFCADFLHTNTVADGDLLTVQVVTGASETGANISALAGWD